MSPGDNKPITIAGPFPDQPVPGRPEVGAHYGPVTLQWLDRPDVQRLANEFRSRGVKSDLASKIAILFERHYRGTRRNDEECGESPDHKNPRSTLSALKAWWQATIRREAQRPRVRGHGTEKQLPGTVKRWQWPAMVGVLILFALTFG